MMKFKNENTMKETAWDRTPAGLIGLVTIVLCSTVTAKPPTKEVSQTTHRSASSVSVLISDYFTKEEYEDMNCTMGNVRYKGQCIYEIDFLKIMNSKENDIKLRREARANSHYTSDAHWYSHKIDEYKAAEAKAKQQEIEAKVMPEDEIEDMACPFDSQVVYKGICIDHKLVVKLREAGKKE